MKTSKAALALIVASALMGCGSEGTQTNASAEAAKTGAATSTATGAAATGAGAKGPAPAATGAQGAGPAKAADAAAAGASLKYMPKDCDEARVFADVSRILTPDTHAALDGITTKALAASKDGKKGEEVLKVLKDGGIEPSKALREVAICANKDDKKTVVAAIYDMSKADKPADVLAKAIETATGTAPKREEIDGVSFLQTKDGEPWLAVVGKNTVLASEGKESIQAVLKGGGGDAEFAESKGHVLWVKGTDGDVDIKAKESGDNFDIVARVKAGKNAEKTKTEFEKMQPEIDKMADKVTVLKPLLPAAKNAKLAVDGEFLNVTTNFPKKAIAEVLNTAKDMSMADLEKQMKGF